MGISSKIFAGSTLRRQTLTPADAAMVTRDFIQPKVVIPMHYGTNPQLPGTPEAFIEALGKTRTMVRVMQPGEQLAF